ncbi:MAG: BrnT family toxin, partial [Rhodoferax sp.]|nr:BrnT family toxin [Rhodoferax sp.]
FTAGPRKQGSNGAEIGGKESGRFLVISFTETEDAIRIVSARHMTPPERKAYEQR